MTILGHFVRVSLLWSSSSATPANMQALDQRIAQAVNGDAGGCWAPQTQLTFTGGFYGLTVTGPVVVYGGSGTLTSTGTSRFVCAAGDFPLFSATHAGRSRKIVTSILSARSQPWAQLQPAQNADGTYHGEMQTVSYATQAYNATSPTPTTIIAPLEVHNGGTIASVTFSFAVSTPHTQPPASMPKARIFRADVNGTRTFLTSSAAGADVSGFVSAPVPSTGAAYYNNGAFQTFTVTCDQNNVANTALYSYHAEIVEEQNGSYTPILQAVDLCTNFDPSSSSPRIVSTVDGVSPAVGMRILFRDQTYLAQNGIWVFPGDGTGLIGHLGIPYRAPDMPLGSVLVPGTQIPIKSGNKLAGSMVALSVVGTAATVDGTAQIWSPSPTSFTVGAKVVPTRPNGFVYTCTTAGTVAANEPSAYNTTPNPWPTMPGTSVTDGTVVWQCSRDPSAYMAFGTIGQPPLSPPAWSASVSNPAMVSPTVPNGLVYAASLGAGTFTTGATEPTWPTQINNGVADNGGVWVAWGATYNQGGTAMPIGNIWGDVVVAMTNIPSLAFQ